MSTRLRSLDTLRRLDPLQQANPHNSQPEQQEQEQHGEERRAHARLLALASAHPRPATFPTAPSAASAASSAASSAAMSVAAASVPARGRRDARSSSPLRWAARSRSRWITVGVAGLAAGLVVSVAAVVVPTGFQGAAFASWSAVPAAMAVADVQAAGQRCKDNHIDENRDLRGLPSTAAVQRMDTVLAERRGDYTYTLLAGGDWLAECLSGDGSGGGVLAPAGEVDLRTGLSLVPAADGVVVLTAGTQRTSDAGGSGGSTYRWVTGRVGGEVTGVEVTPAGEGVVTATVSNGYFAAWWPAGRADTAELTLHLADGTVVGGIPADPVVSRYEGGPA
ncbi:hypothetical protein [Kineococcus aurantiacus]|uniref:hypothetical protein n=1 Tax=Kineococcus aurantiacus TaxID=37633 RepID=UPI0031E00ACA